MIATFLYMIAIALFNLSDAWCDTGLPMCFYGMSKCYIYWSAFFYVSIFSPITFLFYKVGNSQVNDQKRLVYYSASILSGLYCIYASLTILSKDIAFLFNKWESFVWSTVIVLVIILLLYYLLYKFIIDD